MLVSGRFEGWRQVILCRLRASIPPSYVLKSSHDQISFGHQRIDIERLAWVARVIDAAFAQAQKKTIRNSMELRV